MTNFTIDQVSSYDCPECRFTNRMDERARAEGRPVYPRRPCNSCSGVGTVKVDGKGILAAVVNSRGSDKGKLRKSRPALPNMKNGIYGAAYVWRIIRFDVGQDMCMPVMAYDYVGLIGSVQVEDEPLRQHLDTLVDLIGNELFGKIEMMRGAARWGQVLGFEGADDVAAVVAGTVGMPLGNGSAIGDMFDSPEAVFDTFVTENGSLDIEELV